MQFLIKFPHIAEFNFPGLPVVIFPQGEWIEYRPGWGKNAALSVNWAIANKVTTMDPNGKMVDTSTMTTEEARKHISGFISWASRFDQ